MRNSKILFIIGIWVIILTFLGFPSRFKDVLFVLTGLLIIYLDLLISKELKKEKPSQNTFKNFSENLHSLEDEKEEFSNINETQEKNTENIEESFDNIKEEDKNEKNV